MDKRFKYKKGFTLIELIVALGIFSIVAIFSVSSLLNLMSANRKTSDIQNVQDNIRFAMESMAKEIRLGRSYECSGSTCSFVNSKKEQVSYTISDGIIKKDYDPVTSSNVNISGSFYENTDGQPRITVIINAKAGEGEINVQTTISKRALGGK